MLGLDRAFFAHTRHWDITYVIIPPILLSSPSRPSKLCWSRPRSRLMDLLILLTEVFLIPCFQVQSLVVLLTWKHESVLTTLEGRLGLAGYSNNISNNNSKCWVCVPGLRPALFSDGKVYRLVNTNLTVGPSDCLTV